MTKFNNDPLKQTTYTILMNYFILKIQKNFKPKTYDTDNLTFSL